MKPGTTRNSAAADLRLPPLAWSLTSLHVLGRSECNLSCQHASGSQVCKQNWSFTWPSPFWEGGVPILIQYLSPESYQGVGSFGLTGLTPLHQGLCLPDTTSRRNEGAPHPANSSRGFLCSAGELSRLALTSVSPYQRRN